MRRDWKAAREKCDDERHCRVCGSNEPVEAAHIIPRSRAQAGPAEDPRNICPLCRMHHVMFDSGTLDLLPYLHRDEQAYVVELVGLYEAYRRVTNERLAA